MLRIVPVLFRGALDDKNNCVLFIARGTNQIWQPSERNGSRLGYIAPQLSKLKKFANCRVV